MENYIGKLYEYTSQNGGTVRLSALGAKVPRPAEITGSLKKIIQCHGQSQFRYEYAGPRGQDTVSIRNGPKGPPATQTSPEKRVSASNTMNQIQKLVDRGKTFRLVDGIQCHYVADPSRLDSVAADIDSYLDSCRSTTSETSAYLAVDCEGVPDDLQLVQIATRNAVYLLDCHYLGKESVCKTMEKLLSDPLLIKLIHDLHKAAYALQKFGVNNFAGVLDTQLLGEFLTGEPFLGFNSFLSKFDLPTHPSKDFIHSRMKSGVDLWSERPIPSSALEYAALDVSLLLNSSSLVDDRLANGDRDRLVQASSLRAKYAIQNAGVRSICFDKANDYSLSSSELLRSTREDEAFFGERLIVESNTEDIFSILPEQFKSKLVETKKPNILDRLLRSNSSSNVDETSGEKVVLGKLSDIVVDIGRRPQCWVQDKRVFLCDDEFRVVQKKEIQEISDSLGTFGSDNRAGLNGKLHRFAAIRDRDMQITGITIRIGRHVRGNAAMLMDVLMGSSEQSILILGEPGSGKTTIVREATRMLAESRNVIVVDTSNEIAGDGALPHSCIGLARRMMVPSLDQQCGVMVECVQNHTPHVMVIDEIGRPKEVQAARTVKQRGVRMIASAHGDLRRLIKNKELCGLVGGIEHVTMGDDMAKQEARRKQERASKQDGENRSFSVSKTKVQRGGEPTFEVIVEVRRGARHEWRIITDSARAVDSILDGLRYKAQLRTRDPETGCMRLEFVDG